MKEAKKVLKVLGSLWFATTILLAMMLAMGSATIFETTHGAEQTKALFYLSPWFKGLEWLLALNVLASLLARLPFKKSLIPFYMAHVGILIMLLGALLTEKLGIEGMLSLREGMQSHQYVARDDILALTGPEKSGESETSILPYLDSTLKKATLPDLAEVKLDDIHIRALRYWPDMKMERRYANDNATKTAALQITLGDIDEEIWVMSNRRQFAGGMHAAVIQHATAETWASAEREAKDAALGPQVVATIGGSNHNLDVKRAFEGAVAVPGTQYTVKIHHYHPHAGFDGEGKVINISDQAINPTLEVEITKDKRAIRRLLFANAPDFVPMNAEKGYDDLKLVFKPGIPSRAHAPLEFHVSPDNEVAVRMAPKGDKVQFAKVGVGETVQTAWPKLPLTVHKVLDKARQYSEPVMPDPIRKNRQPAIEIEVTTPKGTQKFWMSKYSQRPIQGKKGAYQLAYRERLEDLGFTVRLEEAKTGHYPGGTRPRTYHSKVIFEDPETGVQESCLISMNKPGKHGGFVFYQSGLNDRQKPATTHLSVARDPGMPIVFIGYFLTMGGILALIVIGMMKATRKRDVPDSESGSEHGGDQA